ncbi:patatin-like phospholipase family protein [Myxococcaceae bacterium GXIMD 01537]
MGDRVATLVLAGGGAKGAFQVGAERVLREEFGFRWERVFGVSVGALNGSLIAQGQYARLMNIWLTLREGDIYKKVPWPLIAFRIGVLGKLGFYDHSPLRALIQENVAGRPFQVPVRVGRVSLVSGLYEQVENSAPDFLDAIWQSATMPVIWDVIGPRALADGGLRNVTPLGDALEYDPTEVVVILCNMEDAEPAKPPANIIDVAVRSLTDVTVNEIMRNDVDEFVRINDLVRQATEAGLTLTKMEGGTYRYCPITLVQPQKPLGNTLDFSQEAIRLRMLHGEEVARESVRPAAVNRSGLMLPPKQPGPEHPPVA